MLQCLDELAAEIADLSSLNGLSADQRHGAEQGAFAAVERILGPVPNSEGTNDGAGGSDQRDRRRRAETERDDIVENVRISGLVLVDTADEDRRAAADRVDDRRVGLDGNPAVPGADHVGDGAVQHELVTFIVEHTQGRHRGAQHLCAVCSDRRRDAVHGFRGRQCCRECRESLAYLHLALNSASCELAVVEQRPQTDLAFDGGSQRPRISVSSGVQSRVTGSTTQKVPRT